MFLLALYSCFDSGWLPKGGGKAEWVLYHCLRAVRLLALYSCSDSGWQLKGGTRLLSPISLPKAVGLLVAAGWLQKGRDKAAESYIIA